MAAPPPPIPGYEPIFHGGALAKISSNSKTKLNGEYSLQGPVNSKQLHSAHNTVHPESTYKILDNGAWKMPDVAWKESKPLGAQKLAPAEKLRGGWEDAPVDKPSDGARMVVRANLASLKSKFAGVPPRPAAPPPLPTNEKLAAGMKLAIEPSDKENAPSVHDLVVATFPLLDKKKDAKWRVELKVKGWERGIAVLAETPNASFKIPNAASKVIEVRGAVVDPDGKSSLWTPWRTVPSPDAPDASDAAAADAPPAAASAAAAGDVGAGHDAGAGGAMAALEERLARLEDAAAAAAAEKAEVEARAAAREAELLARLEEAMQRADAAEAKLAAAPAVS